MNACKAILIGAAEVGKTTILCRYADIEIPDRYVATVGIDFRSKQVDVDGKTVQVCSAGKSFPFLKWHYWCLLHFYTKSLFSM